MNIEVFTKEKKRKDKKRMIAIYKKGSFEIISKDDKWFFVIGMVGEQKFKELAEKLQKSKNKIKFLEEKGFKKENKKIK